VSTPPRRAGQWKSDPRLVGYLVGGFGALVVAIAGGLPVFAVLGAPLLALAAVGLVGRDPVDLRGVVELRQIRVLEGDVVEGHIEVSWDGIAEVDVRLAGFRGVTPIHPKPRIGWSLPPTSGPVTLPFRLHAGSWGEHELGGLWVRVRRPGSLLFWEARLADAPRLRVLPGPLRLDRLLPPDEPRAVAGMHLSRLRGHGTDFAELRPYQPGDRMRDLSWGTSARLGEPWVIVHHPERTGTVLLLLDAFHTDDPAESQALARSARAAWAVASSHLRAQDRVGILAHGVTAAWIPPGGGRRARWMILDELLGVGGAVEDRVRRAPHRGRAQVPSDALVIGVTTLAADPMIPALLKHRRSGHTTAALVIDRTDFAPTTGDRIDDAALRLFRADRAARRARLERAGVPTALVSGDDGVRPAISGLRRRIDRTRGVAGRAS
jgi:uncharacterized protein (DUF58 family)